jgi:tetratricopeptide (TPR) repeat protein
VCYANQGWHQDAKPLLLRALQIREALAARENAELEDRIHLANGYGSLSALLRKAGELAAAEAPGRSSVAIFEAIANEHLGQPLYRYQLANGLNGLSHQLWLMGQRDEATMVMNRALDLAETVATESPEVPDYRHRVADIHGCLAEFFWEDGRYPEAIQARRKALDQHVLLESKHQERDYEKHIAQNQRFLAMMLAGCPDPRFRDPAEAVRLAQAAVDILPSGGNSWCALGEARYRAHEWKGAVEALKKSLTLDDAGVAGRAWILMAMSNCKRGRRDEAYRYYERARLALNKPDSADNQPRRFRHGVDRHLNLFLRPESALRELNQLQAEAESLLRLADQGIQKLPKR